MRARFRWVSAAVVLSAGVGAAAAFVQAPLSTSGASGLTRPAAAVVVRDQVTPEVRALASEAQQLGHEIASAQGELTYLEHEVAYEATLSHLSVSAPTPTLRVAPSTGPRVRDDRGAFAPSGSAREGTTTSSTTSVPSTSVPVTTAPTTTLATTTTSCTPSYGDATFANGAACPTGASHDD